MVIGGHQNGHEIMIINHDKVSNYAGLRDFMHPRLFVF
ncbi:hypothetical protein SAMN04489735_101951 [Aneurinibacillus thermoaerophilus]|uniref:Uncharacterized protein n=1 Tax=Aneurinibacillus thermoaerophilus TaxID=143495 RepID=A0A1G8BFW9_ANETH|nr:hypothetical protein SAMN04489735_101951 [Aneurinibacillus thermoaerophilus]